MTRAKKKHAAEETGLVEAPLAALEIAPENAQARSEAHIARLAANIRAYGLKQNLVGYRGDDGRVYVTAGGSRLLALRKLRHNAGVPVRLEPRADATSTALAENVIRTEMPTGARVRAWKRLHDEGHSAERIMKAFSIEKRLYDRTMRLADLPDPILDALDAGEITLDHAAAFTAGRPDEALALYQEITDGRMRLGPGAAREIRARLTREKVPADSALAVFVGREAYEKKGGTVTEDLFQEEVFFENRKLLHDLAQSKLAREAKKLRKEWAWVEVSVTPPSFEHVLSYGQLLADRHESGRTPEEEAELKALYAKFEATPEDEDPLSEAEAARYHELEDREPVAVWTPEQRQVAGAIVTIDSEGETVAIEGLVKPEDVERAVEAGVMEGGRAEPDPAAVAKAAKEDGAWKQAVIDDCIEIRKWALRSELAGDPERLIYLLAADLAGRFMRTFDYTFEVRSRDRLVEQGLTVHPALEGGSDKPELAQVLALPRADVDAMLTRTLALRLVDHGGYAVAALPPDVRAWWTPNETFLKRLSKDQLVAIAGELDLAELRNWAAMKKGDVASILANVFAGRTEAIGGTGSEAEANATLREAAEAARTWLPPCLRPKKTAEAAEMEEA